MNDSIPYYCKSLDWDKLIADFPPPPLYATSVGVMSADALYALQNERFMARVQEAWEVPFYRDRWSRAGLAPGDIKSLADIQKIPAFNSDDLKAAIEAAPPFGSHHPFGRTDLGKMPIKIQTSGGTTGMPRVTLFDPLAWEVQGIQTARGFYAQGARPGDIIQIPYTASLSNSGWSANTAVFNWLGAVPLTTGAGNVTSSERQLEYAKAWGTNGWYAQGDYLGRLTHVAREMGFDLRQLPTKYLFTFLGPDTDGSLRQGLEDAWGAPVYDNYGSHEAGLVAWECVHKDHKHINEDTTYIEVCDVDGKLLPDGESGSTVITSLYRSVPLFIRYDQRDRMTTYPRSLCACGVSSRKLSALFGRIDEMVKLRGTNIYPMGCQGAVKKDPRTTGEFLCVVAYVGDGLGKREEMTVRVERRSKDIDAGVLAADLAAALKNDLGARVGVEVVDAGDLDEFTKASDKPRRLLDLRKR